MESFLKSWSPLLALVVSGLLFVGYYHPKRYHVFIFLPFSIFVFLFTLGSICYFWGSYQAMVALIPYLDKTKIEDIRAIADNHLMMVDTTTSTSLSIVCAASLIASLLEAAGIVAANRDVDASHQKPDKKNKTPKD